MLTMITKLLIRMNRRTAAAAAIMCFCLIHLVFGGTTCVPAFAIRRLHRTFGDIPRLHSKPLTFCKTAFWTF